MKAIIYCRKSTESEERQVQSLEAQQNWCREYANTNSFEVVEEIIESKSAKEPWREWFNKMMSLFSTNKAEVIICWQLNRLSRNPIDEWTVKWLSQSWTIKEIHSTDGISNWQNILLMSVHFGMATQFVIDLKKNVMRWMMQKFEKWGALWHAPTWYWNDKNTNEYAVDEQESEFVKDIFTLRAKKYSYKKISEILFKKWFKTKSWKLKGTSTIEQIVRNQFYIWIIRFSWKVWKWHHKTFISKKLFDEANGFRKTSKILWNINHDKFIFKGLIKYQWKPMRAYMGKTNVYYREAEWVKPNFNISQWVLLERIKDELPHYVLPEELKKDFCEWLVAYFNEMNKWNKNSTIQTRKKIDELKEENKEIVRKNIRWKVDDEMAEEMQTENLMKIKNFEWELSDYSKVDELIEAETVELFRMFTQSQKVWESWDLFTRGLLLKILLVELNFDKEKQLNIENTKLFENIRNINFTKWQSRKESNPECRIWNPEL
jgi:hypothetical protein